jgi:hypothetical protein
MIAPPRRLGSPDVPAPLLPGEIIARYPALDRIWLRAAYAFTQQPGAGPALCAYAALRALADDGAAFADDALHASARLAAALGLRTAALTALDRMRARSAEHRAMREAVRAAVPAADVPLEAWFAGPARIARTLADLVPSEPGRTLAVGVNAALLVAYAPERRWSLPLFGPPAIAARRYAAGTFARAVIADPCVDAARDAVLAAAFELGIPAVESVEPAGSAREVSGARAQTLIGGLMLPAAATLNAPALWSLALGAPEPPSAQIAVDVVRWTR